MLCFALELNVFAVISWNSENREFNWSRFASNLLATGIFSPVFFLAAALFSAGPFVIMATIALRYKITRVAYYLAFSLAALAAFALLVGWSWPDQTYADNWPDPQWCTNNFWCTSLSSLLCLTPPSLAAGLANWALFRRIVQSNRHAATN
jgi:hypothetical protein